MKMKRRLTPDERRAVILYAAIRLTKKYGVFGWTCSDVARACEVSTSEDTVKHYWSQQDLRAAVKKALA